MDYNTLFRTDAEMKVIDNYVASFEDRAAPVTVQDAIAALTREYRRRLLTGR